MTADVLWQLAGWLLLPIAVFVIMILVQVAQLLYGVQDCLTVIRYELLPALKDVRLMVANAENLSDRMVHGAQLVEKSMVVGQSGVQALVQGIRRSFEATGRSRQTRP